MFKPYADILAGNLDFDGTSAEYVTDPIAVGAVGGSGTRVLAAILADAGVAMATPINPANDATEWPPLSKFLSPEMLARFPREQIIRNAFSGLDKLLQIRRHKLGLGEQRAGWKVPGTYIWLEELAEFFPDMQYIHLIRSGLDMAYSDNQRQTQNWGHAFDVDSTSDESGITPPGIVLEYWLRANEAVLATASALLPGRFLLVRFEQLCADPAGEIRRITEFLGLELDNDRLTQLAASIKSPKSIDRYRQKPWRSDFSNEQINRLAQLGYQPEPGV